MPSGIDSNWWFASGLISSRPWKHCQDIVINKTTFWEPYLEPLDFRLWSANDCTSEHRFVAFFSRLWFEGLDEFWSFFFFNLHRLGFWKCKAKLYEAFLEFIVRLISKEASDLTVPALFDTSHRYRPASLASALEIVRRCTPEKAISKINLFWYTWPEARVL